MNYVQSFFNDLKLSTKQDMGGSVYRNNAIPMDANSVFESYDDLCHYVKGDITKIQGSCEYLDNAYPGMIAAVVASAGTQLYVIVYNEASNSLEPVEIQYAIEADNETVILENNRLSIKDFESAFIETVPFKNAAGKLEWVPLKEIVDYKIHMALLETKDEFTEELARVENAAKQVSEANRELINKLRHFLIGEEVDPEYIDNVIGVVPGLTNKVNLFISEIDRLEKDLLARVDSVKNSLMGTDGSTAVNLISLKQEIASAAEAVSDNERAIEEIQKQISSMSNVSLKDVSSLLEPLQQSLEERINNVNTLVSKLQDTLLADNYTGYPSNLGGVIGYLRSDMQTQIDDVRSKLRDAYKGDLSYFTTVEKWNQCEEVDLQKKINLLCGMKPSDSPVIGNLFVVKDLLYEGSTAEIYELYVFTDAGWVQIVGKHLPADHIILKDNIVYTDNIGRYRVPACGHGTIECKGKSVSELLNMMLYEERESANNRMPSVSIKTYNFKEHEIGSEVELGYKLSLDPGYYEYGPKSGAHIENIVAKIYNCDEDYVNPPAGNTSSEMEHYFDKVVVTEESNYRIEVSYTLVVENGPNNNVGKSNTVVDDVTETLMPPGFLTGYAPVLYGYTTSSTKVSIDKAVSNGLSGLNLNRSKSLPKTVDCKKMKQLIIAIPCDRGVKEVLVANASTTMSQHVYKYDGEIVVNFGNGQLKRYNMWYVENENADQNNNSYKFTYVMEGDEE